MGYIEDFDKAHKANEIFHRDFERATSDIATMGYKVSQIFKGLNDMANGALAVARVMADYTMTFEDQARVAQRGTALWGKNIDEFKKYNKEIQNQGYLYSSLTGKTIQESQEAMAKLQATMKQFDVEPTIDLTRSQMMALRDAAEKMAKGVEGGQEAYDKLLKSLPQSQKDLLAFDAVAAHLSVSLKMSSEQFASFTALQKGSFDMSVEEITKVASMMQSGMEQYGLSGEKMMATLKENEARIMGMPPSARAEFQRSLLMGAGMVQKAGVDFTKGIDKMIGAEGDDEIEKAALLAAGGGGDIDELMGLFSREKAGGAGGQQAALEIQRRQLQANANITGIDATALADLRARQADINYTQKTSPEQQAKDNALAFQTGISRVIGNAMGGGYAMTTQETLTAQGNVQSMLTGEKSKRNYGEITTKTPEEILKDAASMQGRMTVDEQTASAKTQILGKALPDVEAMEQFNGVIRETIKDLSLFQEGVTVLTNMWQGMNTATTGAVRVGRASLSAATFENITQAELNKDIEEASKHEVASIIAGLPVAGVAGLLGGNVMGAGIGQKAGGWGTDFLGKFGFGKGEIPSTSDDLDSLLNPGNTPQSGGNFLDSVMRGGGMTGDGEAKNMVDFLLKNASDAEANRQSQLEVDSMMSYAGLDKNTVPGSLVKNQRQISTEMNYRQPERDNTASFTPHTPATGGSSGINQEIIGILEDIRTDLRNTRTRQEPQI